MPGLGAPTATEPTPEYVRRFSSAEQSLHWLLAVSFLTMLATGLILYLPSLAEVAAQRQLWKSIHLGAALGFWVGLLLVWSTDAVQLRATRREIDHFDRDDRARLAWSVTRRGCWAPGRPGRSRGWAATARSAPPPTRAMPACGPRCWWTGACWSTPARTSTTS